MNKIFITDMTLKEAGRSGELSLSFKEKIEIARHLENLHVDTIELDEIKDTKTDTLFVSTISAFVKHSSISLPVGMTEESVQTAWNALSTAKRPKLRVEVPVSPVQMEYFCHKKASKMLDLVTKLVKKAVSLCPQTELCAVDATRSEHAFLVELIKTAIDNGVTAITLCDNAAVMMPDEFGTFITGLYEEIPQLKDIDLGVACEDRRSMGLAGVMMAVKAGVRHVNVAVGCNSYPSVSMIAQIIKDCGDKLNVSTSLSMTEFQRITKQIAWIVNTRRSDSSPFDNGVKESDADELTLSKDDDISVIIRAVEKLGYDLSDDDNAKVFDAFIRVALKKKRVSAKELEAIVASTALQVPPTYRLKSYVINSGNVITATAHITFEKGNSEIDGVSVGDGPIDAAFLAIEQIVGHHYELDDFQIQAVTEGREAMGSALVKLRGNSKLYSGNGISTDIIGASIEAYVNALNKIIYEEEQQ